MAGDSKTIMISCTIPEIPGVNAPFAIEQNLPVVDLQTTTQEQQANQQELTQAYESKEELIQQQQSFESITLYTFVAK